MTRVELHKKFVDILDSPNVYYQPPESLRLKYPCIIYNMSRHEIKNADDLKYKKNVCYTFTYITANVDDETCDTLEELKYCSFDRSYSSDNLHHYVYTIYI